MSKRMRHWGPRRNRVPRGYKPKWPPMKLDLSHRTDLPIIEGIPVAPTSPTAFIRNDQAIGERVNQNGVTPGDKKLKQFQSAMIYRGVPPLYSQDGKGDDAIVYVKLFDPCGSWTWYITEFSFEAPDETPNLAFGLVDGHEMELGYINLEELATVKGRLGIGIEIDCHFLPVTIGGVKRLKEQGWEKNENER